MELNCDIIQDLLPLYADDVCSPASRAAVEAHLRECPACRAMTGIAEQLPPVEPPEAPGADRAVVRGIQKVRRRWLRSLVAMVLVVPVLLLSLNQFWGRGICFTNPDDILTAWRFVHALETENWESAASMTTYGSDYENILEALNLPVEAWGHTFSQIELDDESWYIRSHLEPPDISVPAESALFDFVYNRAGSVMIPLELWERVIAVDPSAVQQDGRQYWINHEVYSRITTHWGEFVITGSLQYDSAVEYCEHIDLLPAKLYLEAAGALRAMANETYRATHESIGYVGAMTKEEFEVFMTEKYAAELQSLEALDIQFDCTGFESAYLMTPEGSWNIRFRIALTRGTQSLDVGMELHIIDGHVEIASISHAEGTDWLDQVNRILYPSAHPNY